MIRAWPDIRVFYQDLVARGQPLEAMVRLIEQIETSPYVTAIYGETSMCNLWITQLPRSSYPDGPHLCIAPASVGTIELRYIDTPIIERQWSRVVEEDHAFACLAHFVDAMRWSGAIPPKR